MKIWQKVLLATLSTSVLSACVVHPHDRGYERGNKAYGHSRGNGPKNGAYHSPKVEVYGTVDAGVGYSNTKYKRKHKHEDD
ncbi:hypothetical protein V757_04205 [Pelistega indica]|uniref:Lipoprotein n=2 Tax=Alcaligenaceae TaxID=506 RepID=V8G7U0_9BURK|nr:hypothetical protein V757_04205 [Pelistega indica]